MNNCTLAANIDKLYNFYYIICYKNNPIFSKDM